MRCLLYKPVIFLSFFLANILSLQAQSGEGWVLDILKRYSPDGYRIVTVFEERSGESAIMTYYDDSTFAMKMESLNTIVHELYHGYTGLGAHNETVFYIDEDEVVTVRDTPVFPSREMVSSFPQKLRTFRFSYIDTTEKNLGTQISGIYGILNEMAAYYQGVKTSFEMLPWFEKQGAKARWLVYFDTVNASLYGTLEFKLYFFKYLMWARKNKKEIFEGIVNNKDFVRVFLRVNSDMTAMTKKYMSEKERIYAMLRKNGRAVEETDNMLGIQEGSGIRYTGTFFDEYNLLARELSKPVYGQIMTYLQKKASEPVKDTSTPLIAQARSDQRLEGSSDGRAARSGDTRESSITIGEEGSYAYNTPAKKTPKQKKVKVPTAQPPKPSGESAAVSVPAKKKVPVQVPDSYKVLKRIQDRTGDAVSGIVDIQELVIAETKDKYLFLLQCSSLPNKLIFNNPDLSTDSLEYSWAVDLDIDGKGGHEYSFSIDRFKFKDSEPVEAPMLGYMQTGIWKVTADSGSLTDHKMGLDKKGFALVFSVKKNGTFPVKHIRTGKFSARTYYDNGKKVYRDELGK